MRPSLTSSCASIHSIVACLVPRAWTAGHSARPRLRPPVTRTVLFSYAHPDDESFAGSGLAMQCVAEGGRAVLVTATLGQRGKLGDPPVCRPEEVEACPRSASCARPAGSSGSSDLHLLGFADRELANAPPESHAPLARHADSSLSARRSSSASIRTDSICIRTTSRLPASPWTRSPRPRIRAGIRATGPPHVVGGCCGRRRCRPGR